MALGATTMSELHAHIGSQIETQVTAGNPAVSLTVVGQAVFNNSYDLEAGVGALVTDSFFQSQRGDGPPDYLVVRLRPGVSPEQALAPFTDTGASWFPPTPPAAVRNLERVRWLPWALALLVGVLAAGALAHALLTSVRAHRRDLAVLRTIGFTSGQTGSTVVWEAMALAAVALLVGVPLGLAVGRWGWQLLADQIGVTASSAVPILIAPAVALATVVLSLVLAVWPGTRATRVRPALALRAE